MSEKDVELVLAYIAAYNAKDLDNALGLCTHDVRAYPDRSVFPEAESLVGQRGLRDFLETTWEAWASGAVTPNETRDLEDGRVLVRTDWGGQGSASGAQVSTNLTAIFTVLDGLISVQSYYFDHADALKAVGLTE